jgi:hypothetical protein
MRYSCVWSTEHGALSRSPLSSTQYPPILYESLTRKHSALESQYPHDAIGPPEIIRPLADTAPSIRRSAATRSLLMQRNLAKQTDISMAQGSFCPTMKDLTFRQHLLLTGKKVASIIRKTCSKYFPNARSIRKSSGLVSLNELCSEYGSTKFTYDVKAELQG